ncbi:MAG: hypothetical protein ABIQ35_13360 [Verrucomicrobiota bacterium]
MNLQKLQEKLLAAARLNAPSEQVPFAFEKRIMAHLTRPLADAWSFWGRSLWRAAAACVVAMALLGGWSFRATPNEKIDLGQDFENTVFAALDEHPSLNSYEETW